MDVTTNLTVIGATLFGVGGFVLAGWTIRKLLDAVSGLTSELTKLSVRKSYFVIEKDDQGIRQIQALEDRLGIVEAEQNKPEPKTPAPLDRAVRLARGGEDVPSLMETDSKLITVGERG